MILNDKQSKFLNLLGEWCTYVFILSLFLNRPINLKVGYVLQGLFVLKLIFDRKNIVTKGKEIYKTFGIILILGVLLNMFVSKKDGVRIFFNQNIRFIFGMAFLSFIDDMKKLKIVLWLILLGSSLVAIAEVVKFSLPGQNIERTRPLIMIGAVFSTITLLEVLKRGVSGKSIKYNILLFILALLTVVGIIYSNSRMGLLTYIICLGLYGIYNLTFCKINKKKMMTPIFLMMILFGGVYLLAPKSFKDRMKTSFETKDNLSNEARIVMWKGGVYAFLDKPLTGVGNGKEDALPHIIESAKNYAEKHGKKCIEEAFVVQKQFSEHHSIYMNFLSNNGIILTLLYLYLLFIQIPKRVLLDRKNEVVTSSYFATLSFLIYGITWSVWTNFSVLQILFQIFLAVIIFLTESEIKEIKKGNTHVF